MVCALDRVYNNNNIVEKNRAHAQYNRREDPSWLAFNAFTRNTVSRNDNSENETYTSVSRYYYTGSTRTRRLKKLENILLQKCRTITVTYIS